MKHLFAPLTIGRFTLRNRILFGAHVTNFARHQRFSERHVAYYAARARGGVGLIVLEESIVHPSDWPYERAIFGFDPAIVPAYRRLAEAIHAHGALVVAQLNHTGGQATGALTQAPVWAPSPVPETSTREMPKAMEPEEIQAVVEGFARTAAHAREAGLDGVEIQMGQYALVRQFLSGLTNHRDDAYGGSLENRLRFAREVIAAVREAVGAERLVGVKLCGDEYAPWAGLKPEDAQEIARHLVATGQIDYLTVTSGSIYTTWLTQASMHMPQGYAVHLAAGIRQAIEAQVPVFAQGSIVEPPFADAVIAEGQADGVEMTRALIADPDLPRKAQAGTAVRPCILCNQGCQVRSVMNPLLSCAVNPAAGDEGNFPPLEPSPVPRRVLVVGGGPAGLEAARGAALQGHRVILCEREDALGGAVGHATRLPGRERLLEIVTYLSQEVERLGVEVRLGQTVTAEDVMREAPDAVIVATGARPAPLTWSEADGLSVVSVRDVLLGHAQVGPRVVILDEEGGYPAATLAEYLADRGHQVTLLSADMYVSQKLIATHDLFLWYQRAAAKGIALRPQVEVKRIEDGAVIIGPRFGTAEQRIAADTVVEAGYEWPDQDLYLELKALQQAGQVPTFALCRVGDCVAPRGIGPAILEGHRAAVWIAAQAAR